MDIGGRYDRRVTPPLISAIRDWFLRSLERHPGVSPQPRPAAERGGGLLKREDVLVEFRLWAPGKRSVAVAGTWNGWAKDRDRLSPGRDGIWTASLQLRPSRHEYMFVVDGTTWIGDPYAREVAWGTEGPHAVLHVGKPSFA